jgi:hypothetical protein
MLFPVGLFVLQARHRLTLEGTYPTCHDMPPPG